jgi:hypothetical protein
VQEREGLQRAIERAEYAETVAEHALAMLQEEQGRAGREARQSIEELHAELVAATAGLAQSQRTQQQTAADSEEREYELRRELAELREQPLRANNIQDTIHPWVNTHIYA